MKRVAPLAAVVVAFSLVAFALAREPLPRGAPEPPARPVALAAMMERWDGTAWPSPPKEPEAVTAAHRPAEPLRTMTLRTLGGSGWTYRDSELPAHRDRLADARRKIRGEDGPSAEIWSSFPDFEFERLTQLFPESDVSRSFAEYAEIRGGRYFGYRWLYTPGDFKYDPDREIPGFLSWVARYPGHPGMDDACYRLARCYVIRGDLAEGLRWFERARIAPDGDVTSAATCWSNLLLDALMSEEELEGYVYREGDARAAYSLGLRRFRNSDFEAAVSWMDWAAHGFTLDRASGVRRQIEAVREVAHLAAEVAGAGGEEELAAALYALGRRQYHDPDLYECLLWGEWPRECRQRALESSGLLAIWGHDGAPEAYKRAYRAFTSRLAARRTFLDLAERCPGSPLVAAARFSAATALAHTTGGHPAQDTAACPAAILREVAREYRQLARDFPDSSLADDALYHAALLSGRREALEEVVRLHPDGDFREAALERLGRPLDPEPALGEVHGLLRDLGRGEWTARVAARRLERILPVCVGRVLALEGGERRRAIRALANWFLRAAPTLEFDRDGGGYVLR